MANTGKLVTVFGGSGFVGRYVVSTLAKRGYRVRAAVRRPDLAGHLQPMGNVGQIHAVQANLRYPDSIARAVTGAHAVVNAVGILAPSGAQSFEAVHARGAAAIATAARENDVGRLVHISAIGADENSPSVYAKTKAAGDRAVLGECPRALAIRPSLVFGPEDQFFNRFAALAKVSPFLPLIGSGLTKFQPVYVEDLATAVANAVDGQGDAGTIYEAGGPDILAFRQLLEMTEEYSGLHRWFFPIPFWLAKLQAIVTWPLPNALRPVTVDQVRLLQRDNVVSQAAIKENRTLRALGVDNPVSVAAVVPGYLERFNPRGQYASYRNS